MNSQNHPKTSPLRIDSQGFVYADGVKVFRCLENGCVQVFDRDRRRSDQRGSPYVEVPASDLINVITKKS